MTYNRWFEPNIGEQRKKAYNYAWCSAGKHFVTEEEVRRDIFGIEICSFHKHRVNKSF